MQEVWKTCEDLLEKHQKEKQDALEKIIEEVTQEKFEKIAEIKANYDFMIKRLESSKQKEKADAKRKEKDAEVKAMQEEMDIVKKTRIQEINVEFEIKKKEALSGKDVQIQQKSQQLAINNQTRMLNSSRMSMAVG